MLCSLAVRTILILALLSVGASAAQTLPAVLAELVDKAFILSKAGGSDIMNLKADKLNDLRGSCDLAVLATAAQWQAATAGLSLQTIGGPSISDKQASGW
jgi:hypothetical protein